ncbi:MAG: tocopherol cyclase family protein [Polyangiales bacterium]
MAATELNVPDDPETWNLTRFDPRLVDPKKGHVESYFVKLNDPAAPRALWVKVTVFSPTEKTSGGPPHERGRTVAETWAIAFDHSTEDAPPTSYRKDGPAVPKGARHVAAKQTIPVEDATLARTAPFRIQAAGVEFDGKRLRGEVHHGHARVRFDLVLEPRDRSPFVPFPIPAMYRGAFPKSKLVSPIFDARANGEVIVEGNEVTRSWEVRDWPAMQGHNWGVGHADLYAWAHCNSWNEPEGRDVVFEGFSGRVKAGFLTTPLVTIVGLRHRGVRYEARAIAELARSRGKIDAHRRWSFSAKQAGAELEGMFELTEDDTVGLYYPNPTGEMTYCLNSKIARARLKFTPEGRGPIELTSNAAALEIGTHDAAHGIRMYV